MQTNEIAVPSERIENRIYLVRGQKIILDSDLAELYEVETRVLNQAVRRNQDRFPSDFVFQLTAKQTESLRSQFVISSYGSRRYLPYAFIEFGGAMLSAVLKSQRAIQMSILIMRAVARLRELLASHVDLAACIEQLESNQDHHASVINILADEIDALKTLPPDPPRKRIGFVE